MSLRTAAALLLSLLFAARGALAHPWDDPALAPEKRASFLLAQMTEDEKLLLVHGEFGSLMDKDGRHYEPPPEAIMGSAGYVPGIARLGIPPLQETDAGIGVATQSKTRDKVRERTSLPSGLATAATWNPELAYDGGAMIGAEARDSGFNVMLAGGVNLLREPRNGRNFEYAGEDPLLAGTMVGAEISGIRSNHIISTVKHWAANDQETGRHSGNAILADDQARMSDLLAFEIAIEAGHPGSVMCSYNRYNGDYTCENRYLLTEVLKKDWGFKGFVMSDWGAVYSAAKAFNTGLDQESAVQFDSQPFFEAPLQQALKQKTVAKTRLDDAVRRILYAMFADGLFDHPLAVKPIDYDAHAKVTQSDAEEAMVLLKNDHALLPLTHDIKKLAIIGGHADVGVMAGGGSSMVYPIGGNAVPGIEPTTWPGQVMFDPSSPLQAIRSRLPQADIRYDGGADPAAAAKLAAECDMALVFVTQWAAEDRDSELKLPQGQDALIAAVAAANPRVAVIVESGGPVLMPWSESVGALLEAWFPGTRGGEAIARVLFGEVDASGRLPVTIPRELAQLPHPTLLGPPDGGHTFFDLPYDEGAAVGYKWFDLKQLSPAFPFGYGLSYGRYGHDGLSASFLDGKLTVSFTVTNIGNRAGKDVPQIYVGPRTAKWEAPRRLAGWRKIALQPGESQAITLTVDPRLLAVYNSKTKRWNIAAGEYDLWLGSSSRDLPTSIRITLPRQSLKP